MDSNSEICAKTDEMVESLKLDALVMIWIKDGKLRYSLRANNKKSEIYARSAIREINRQLSRRDLP